MARLATYMVTLRCGHEIGFNYGPPWMGDRIWCIRCAAYRIVTLAEYEYWIKCRPCGVIFDPTLTEAVAYGKAERHARKRGRHRVEIWKGLTVIHTFEPREDSELPPALVVRARALGITPPGEAV